jgi:hypothetical protein
LWYCFKFINFWELQNNINDISSNSSMFMNFKQHFKFENDILSPKTNILKVLKWNINDVNSHSSMSMNSKTKLVIIVHIHQCSWAPLQHFKIEDDLLNPKTTFQVQKWFLKSKICVLKGSKCSSKFEVRISKVETPSSNL